MNPSEKVNILLVDDQPGKLLSYEVMLGELGETLLKASSANEALSKLLRYEVAVILIDVCMPELDGFELAKMIREHPRFQKTAIIFISAIHLAESDYLRGYNAGAVDYLPVPVVPELLRAKVRVFTDLFRKTKQLERMNEELERRVIERTAALEASNSRLMQSERGRGLALVAGNMGSWEYHASDGRWAWDEGHSRIFGIDPPFGFSGQIEVRKFFRDEDWAILERAFDEASEQRNTFQTELRIQRASGEMRTCLIAAAASFDRSGRLTRMDGVTVDITDRKQAEMMQALLAREVDHRARNALAVVQAIIRLARADSQEAYAAAVDGRVRALANTHDLLSKSRWQGADVRSLVEEEMAPYRETGGISVTGPSTILPPEKAQTLGLALHELATNAAKYGALSQPGGSVSIEWSLRDGALNIVWQEAGGPPVQAPAKIGFGTKIISAGLSRQNGDDAEFDWDPAGLKCTITVRCDERGRRGERPSLRHGVSAQPGAPLQTRLLLIEDEPLVGMLTREYLEELGYGVLGPFTNLAEAESAIECSAFEAAILDVNLAGTPVYPLAARLKAMRLPIVFVTGYGPESIDETYSDVPIVQKPIAKDALAKAVETAVGGAASKALRQTA
jgi:two-component sensor histidine kinase/DNA-binding response OmpR family regulator